MTRPPATAVVLDMDGLMLDTEALYKRATQQAAAELDHPMSEEFYGTLVGLTNAATEAAVLRHFGDGFPMAAFRERWNVLWKEELETDGVELKPGLEALLQFLEERGVPKAVATSSDRYYTQASLRAARLDRRFDHVVTVDQVAHGKPAPDLYLEATRRLGVAPVRCVALEDSDVGVMAATRAGLTTIMVPDLRAPSDEARSAAFRVVRTLHDARSHLAALLG